MAALIVNLFAGPGAGKSTQASGLFYRLKMRDVNCELVTEYAKEKTWERNKTAIESSVYIFGNQVHRQYICQDQVDVIITDSPLLLAAFYNYLKPKTVQESLNILIMEVFRAQNNLNIFLNRAKPFSPAGRWQDEKAALDIDRSLREFLEDHQILFTEMGGTPEGLALLETTVLMHLKNHKRKGCDTTCSS